LSVCSFSNCGSKEISCEAWRLHSAVWLQVRVLCLAPGACGAAVNQATQDGATPLFIAAQIGHAAVVQLLVKECGGAAVNQATQNGGTPLHAAAHQGHGEIAKWLVEARWSRSRC
jgi:hypothetical protein